MTIYAVDIRDRTAQAVTAEYDAEDIVRFYKVEAESAQAAFAAALEKANDKLAAWENTLSISADSLELAKQSGPVPMMVSRINDLRVWINNFDNPPTD